MGKSRHSSSRAKLRIPTLGSSKAEQVLISLLKKHNNQRWAHKFNCAYVDICNAIVWFKKWDAIDKKSFYFKKRLFKNWSNKFVENFRKINLPDEIRSYGANILITRCRNYLDTLIWLK